MPRSRRRPPSRPHRRVSGTPATRRRPRSGVGPTAHAYEPRDRIQVRPGQDLSEWITEADVAHMRAELEAAARGDARSAYEHHVAGLMVEGTMTPWKLRELVVLGSEAPDWMYSRWAAHSAYHWMLLEEDPRIDRAVRQTMLIGHIESIEQLQPGDAVGLLELGNRIAGGDWLCEQLAVFEYGGLVDFLDVKAESGLLDRCDRIRDWGEARLSGFVLEDSSGAALQVHDLASGERRRVLNIGALTDRGPDTPVIGRLVPITAEPGWMFESRPVEVDLDTAEAVAATASDEDRDTWVACIGEARYTTETLPYAFSCGRPTLFSSDVVPELTPVRGSAPDSDAGEQPGRLLELKAAGLDDHEANGVMMAELGFIAVRVSGAEAVGTIGPHVAAVVLDPAIFDVLKVHCTAEEHGPHWRTLADGVTEPARTRCLELARLCGSDPGRG